MEFNFEFQEADTSEVPFPDPFSSTTPEFPVTHTPDETPPTANTHTQPTIYTPPNTQTPATYSAFSEIVDVSTANYTSTHNDQTTPFVTHTPKVPSPSSTSTSKSTGPSSVYIEWENTHNEQIKKALQEEKELIHTLKQKAKTQMEEWKKSHDEKTKKKQEAYTHKNAKHSPKHTHTHTDGTKIGMETPTNWKTITKLVELQTNTPTKDTTRMRQIFHSLHTGE